MRITFGEKISIAITSLLIVMVLIFPLNVSADTVSDLNKQKQAAQQQAAQARAQAAAKQQQAAEIQNQISNVNNQISATEQSIAATESQISDTQTNITSLENQIAEQEDKLAAEQDKMGKLIASWYMEGESGLMESVLSANTITEVVNQQEYYDSIRQQVETQIETITGIRDNLNSEKAEKDRHLSELNNLKSSQTDQKNYLETRNVMKGRLLTDTNNAISDLQQEQKSAQDKIAAIDAKIRTLTATRSWGTDVVSGSGGLGVPVYYQTGDYTHLGNSPYTVSQYGCLITSFAMVASYYGHNVTPSDIASNTGIFDLDGYLLVTTPPGIGISVQSIGSVNWVTVDDELSNGHPVIVSIYLPSVGAVNSDGSSHFVVIKGKSGGKYLMNDPISDGRGYSITQVRSMRIIRP